MDDGKIEMGPLVKEAGRNSRGRGVGHHDSHLDLQGACVLVLFAVTSMLAKLGYINPR